MNHLSDYHRYLLAGKIAGNLTKEEALELDQYFQHHAEIRLAYQQMLNELPDHMIEDRFTLTDRPGYWKKAEDLQLSEKKGVIALFTKIAVAIISIGLALGIWLWYPSASTHKETVNNTTKPHPGVQLKLANGKIFDLSTQQGSIVDGATTLIHDAKSLTYSSNGDKAAGTNTVQVPIGMDYQITLSDGSKVWMNSLTRLDFPFQFDADKREITLRGEAYIEVAHNSSQPFIVHLPGSSVKVLGTAFNINTYDPGVVKVALVEGAVNLTGGNAELRLTPGNQAVYTVNGSIEQETFNAKSVLSWRNGVIYFEYADLQEIGNVLQRWFGIKISIDNPALNQKRIKGILNKEQPLSVFLDDLKFIANIDGQLDKENVLHFK